ncbi:MAG: Asp-tRNA(Asn)/Glu-tRNA(Gln) amidotransferase GatCAB subunit B, partial [Methylobacteriaceae bacterium]|nr:Asp-tRNA(Asn)/Glu-tRNA(Gln) amidotransferase GatCAB subunit B [Methylobacteriaceae bacterium]
DLLPLEFDEAYVAALAAELPELPDAKKARFIAQYGLSPYDADVLVGERAAADFFEDVVGGNGQPRDGKAAANWVINEFFGRLNREGGDIATAPISAAQIGGIIDLITEGEISGKMGKDLFDIVWTEGGDPRAIAKERGLTQMTDAAAIESVVDAVVAANPEKAAQAKAKPAMLGWFVGQVMKQTSGRANPQAVNAAIRAKLGI